MLPLLLALAQPARAALPPALRAPLPVDTPGLVERLAHTERALLGNDDCMPGSAIIVARLLGLPVPEPEPLAIADVRAAVGVAEGGMRFGAVGRYLESLGARVERRAGLSMKDLEAHVSAGALAIVGGRWAEGRLHGLVVSDFHPGVRSAWTLQDPAKRQPRVVATRALRAFRRAGASERPALLVWGPARREARSGDGVPLIPEAAGAVVPATVEGGGRSAAGIVGALVALALLFGRFRRRH